MSVYARMSFRLLIASIVLVAGSLATTAYAAVLGANVSGTKTASGAFTVGSTVTYTIVLTNSAAAQADNPGNELTDVLPATLALVSANAPSGTTVATGGTNTVTWNGAIATSVTITITATILPTAAGTTVTNQGSISFDANGDGANDSSAVTDDPGVVGPANPTSFNVPSQTPAFSPAALLLLAAALAGVALVKFTRMR